MENQIFVTGATGFIGGALVLELLERTFSQILCLVRPSAAMGAQERLISQLTRAARFYDKEDLLPAIEERCVAAKGDLLEPACGIDGAWAGNVKEVWHSAATLKFEDEDEAEIMQHNVQGTLNVCAAARRLNARQINYVSTAYVSGAREGLSTEVSIREKETANNAYERSKITAERLLREASLAPVRIFRPSIVIGHSTLRTAAGGYMGLYGFWKKLFDLKRKLSYWGAAAADRIPRLLVGNPELPINLVPVDIVAANMVAINERGPVSGIFHITNSAPPGLEVVIRALFEEAGLPMPSFVPSLEQSDSRQRSFDQGLSFYRPYMTIRKTFDQTNTNRMISPEASRCPMTEEDMRSYVRWFHEYLEQERVMAEARRRNTTQEQTMQMQGAAAGR